ncbi:hypothetical protein GCM10023311_16810 [Flaviramulus aquimarinus]|uniref:histidine kinase n=1 Tax=Flaviramulus aquimarinus TaxID=1170456 RepID=A0ABP9F593_9FLAO
MKHKFLSIIFVFFSLYGFSQNPLKLIDSLKLVIASKPQDSIKIKAYSDLCWYYRNISTDSAFAYGNLALKLSKSTQNKLGEAQAYNDIGIIHYGLADFNKSIRYYKKTLNIREQMLDSMGMASAYNKLGISYQRTFKLDSSIIYATEALKIYEAKNHIKYATVIKNNIANIHQDLKQYKKALSSHLEIAETCKKINDYVGLTRSYTNIGNSYLFLKDTLNSFKFYQKGIEIAQENGYQRELATIYNNLGSLFKNQEKFEQAIIAFNKAFVLRSKLKDNYGISSAAINLGVLYLSTGETSKAKDKLNLGLNISKKTAAKELEMKAYEALLLYQALKKNTDRDSIIYYQKRYNLIQDSIFNNRITKQVTEVQEKYNAAEREKEIQVQRANLAEKELKLNKKNTQLIGLGILAVFISLLGYLLFNQQKLKNRQLQREGELKDALIKIETQNRLQEQRLSISRDLHDNIGAQLTFIISSIENLQYGFKITNKKLTNKLQSISAFTKETIYELRDTIWAMNKNEITLEDLQARISNFIDKADTYSNNMAFSFNVDKSVSKALIFTSVKGMNIYRIVQEAINNAIKYSEAKSVSVNISKVNQGVKIEIKDNGKGFKPENSSFGNGLNNMKKRAQELQTNISIESHLGKGTVISLIV